jgi:hypothetical protein
LIQGSHARSHTGTPEVGQVSVAVAIGQGAAGGQVDELQRGQPECEPVLPQHRHRR